MKDGFLQNTIKLKNITFFAQEILRFLEDNKRLDRATVILLKGDLGAGKTTFTQHLARELGVEETVVSPTFVLVKKYQTKHPHFKKLVHIDAYRLHSADELLLLGWEEWSGDADSLIIVEWPSQVNALWQGDEVELSFAVEDENTRVVTLVS